MTPVGAAIYFIALEHLNQQCMQCAFPFIQDYPPKLEKITDQVWVAYEIVLSQAHVGWRVEGENKDLEVGSQSLKLLIGHSGTKGLFLCTKDQNEGILGNNCINCNLPPSNTHIAELLQPGEIWCLVNWWEDRISTEWYAVQKTAEAEGQLQDIRRRSECHSFYKGTYHKRVNFYYIVCPDVLEI